jgi:hypothetical protein
MKTFEMEHIYTGQIHIIYGYDIYHALKINNLDKKFWKII